MKSVLIPGLLIFTSLLSCDKNENKIEELITSKNNIGVCIEDFNTVQIKCDKTIDSLNPYVLNNFASHIEIPLNDN